MQSTHMKYTVQQLATLADITVRTLHHYDAIGLLPPAHVKANGYREYGEAELLKLQQIMFFRELEFPLEEIKKILNNPEFDMSASLLDHRKLIEFKKKRMSDLVKTIDKTLQKINYKKSMADKDLYDGFSSQEEADAVAKEAKDRWGNTLAYKQSEVRYAKLSKEDKLRIKEDSEILLKEIVSCMDKGATSPQVQHLITKHYASLRTYYEPSIEIYRGLADMYVGDPRFSAYFEKYHKELPKFMRDAMHVYCDSHTR